MLMKLCAIDWNRTTKNDFLGIIIR